MLKDILTRIALIIIFGIAGAVTSKLTGKTIRFNDDGSVIEIKLTQDK